MKFFTALYIFVHIIPSTEVPKQYNDKIRECNHDLKRANEVFQTIPSRYIIGNRTIGALLKVCQNAQKRGIQAYDWANYFWNIKVKEKKNHIAFSQMIDICGRNNQFDHVDELFLEMNRQGVTPDVVTFTSVIDANVKLHRFDRVDEIFQEMNRQGVTPDVVTFSSVIDACAKLHRFDRVDEIFQEMKNHGVTPDVVTFSSIIDANAKLHRFDRVDEIFEEMKSHGVTPGVVTFNSVIDSYMKCGLYDRAKNMFQHLIMEELVPEEYTQDLFLDYLEKTEQFIVGKNAFRKIYGTYKTTNRMLDCHNFRNGTAFLQLLVFLDIRKPSAFTILTGSGLAHSENKSPYEMRDYITNRILTSGLLKDFEIINITDTTIQLKCIKSGSQGVNQEKNK